MRIAIKKESDTPIYQQIKNTLAADIHSGQLPGDTRLPSTRQLSVQLGVNRVTVANAYAALQSEGLIYGKGGSGTFVAPNAKAQPEHQPAENYPAWQQRLAEADLPGGLASQVSPLSEQPGLISFSSGMGAEELFPADDYRKALQTVLQQDRADALGYGDLAGYYPLRLTISQYLAAQGLRAGPENILITSGAQQAMNLLSRLLLRQGDLVLVEDPTYTSALDLFHAVGAVTHPLAMDEDGLLIAALKDALERLRPALIYTIPNFHNPTGISLSTPRRHQLVQLAHDHNVPVLEDEFAGDLRYDGKPRPALKALDPYGNVIYTGTFSTILMPGLRIAYMVAHGPVYKRLLLAKQVNDLSTSELIQRGLNEYITSGRYDKHLAKARRTFRTRRNIMDHMLKKHLPSGCSWHFPQGGLFFWVRLPAGLSATALQPMALQHQVSYAPGNQFSPSAEADGYIRLNFASQPPERIAEGIRRLAAAIRSARS